MHPPSPPCDGFSAAMLNFTDWSIPTAQSPPLWLCFAGVVRWWTDSSWNAALGEERACCVSRKLRGGGVKRRRGEKESDLGVPWERTSRLLCFLIPLSSEQQGGKKREEMEQKGVKDDEGEGIMFSPMGSRRVGPRKSLCVYNCTPVILSFLKPQS